jgi:hypothetical protein
MYRQDFTYKSLPGEVWLLIFRLKLCFLQHTSSDWHLLKVWINNDAFKKCASLSETRKITWVAKGAGPKQKRKKRKIPITMFTMPCYVSWVFFLCCVILIAPWSIRKLWETHCIREYNYVIMHIPALLKRPSAFRGAGELVFVHGHSCGYMCMSVYVCMSACVYLWVCLAWLVCLCICLFFLRGCWDSKPRATIVSNKFLTHKHIS